MKEKAIFAVMVIGNQTPSVTFDDYWEAEQEAMRLVRKERKPAYVMKVIAFIELSEVSIIRYDI